MLKNVFLTRDPNTIDELIEEFVKAEYGVVKTDDGWKREDYDNEAYVRELKVWYKEQFPDRKWKPFITAWWGYWEYSSELLEIYFYEEGEVDYWLDRGIRFLSDLWDSMFEKEEEND